MMMTAVEINDRMDPLAAEGERLAQHLKASPFLREGWVDAWWRAFGVGRLQIFAAYQNGRLVGVLPLCRYRGVLSSTTNLRSPLFGFLAANGTAAEALAHALFSQKPRRIHWSLLTSFDVGVSLVHTAAEAAGYRASSIARLSGTVVLLASGRRVLLVRFSVSAATVLLRFGRALTRARLGRQYRPTRRRDVTLATHALRAPAIERDPEPIGSLQRSL